jgi:hypothetical protein
MILMIDDSLTVDDIQDRFNTCFPDLKIEFFAGNITRGVHRIAPDTRLGVFRNNHLRGALEIKSWETVRKVEIEFRNSFGLKVHISGNTTSSLQQPAHIDHLT